MLTPVLAYELSDTSSFAPFPRIQVLSRITSATPKLNVPITVSGFLLKVLDVGLGGLSEGDQPSGRYNVILQF